MSEIVIVVTGQTGQTGPVDTTAQTQLAAHLADTSDAHDASAISFSATGNIVATDVQAAIAELDSDAAVGRSNAETEALAAFWTALSDRNANPVDILVGPGTSISAGIGVAGSGGQERRYTNRLIQMLRHRFPVSGIRGGFGFVPGYASGPGTPVQIATTGTVANVNYGLGNRALSLGTGATAQYQSGVWCSSFVAHFKRDGSDAFTISVDGVLVSTATAGPTGTWTYTSSALTPGNHTILITQTAGTPILLGVMLYDGDETVGIRMWDSSKGGSQVGDWLASAGGSEDWASRIGTMFTPDLWIIEQLTNDGATAPATYGDRLAEIIALGRAQAPDVPIVLLTLPRRGGSPESGASWDDYVAEVDAIAAATANCAHLNLDRALSITVPGYLYDAIHPNAAGHDVIAQALLDFIVPLGSGSGDARGLHVRGKSTLWNHTSSEVPLTVVGAPSQSVNLLEAKTVDGTTVLSVATDGQITNTGAIVSASSITGSTAVVSGTNAAAAATRMNGPAGSQRALQFTTAGVLRWGIIANTTTESGSNAGSDLQILARADDGSALSTPVTITRSTGAVAVGSGGLSTTGTFAATGAITASAGVAATGTVTATSTISSDTSVVAGTNSAAGSMRVNGQAGGVRQLQFATAGSNRWIISANGTAESGGNAGSDLQIAARADDGSAVVTVMTITRSTGDITLGTNVDLACAAGGVLRTGRNATASRPTASSAGNGAMFYDTTLSKPIWSDGSVWRDAAGTAV